MEFAEWREKFSSKHISEREQSMLSELKSLRDHAHLTASKILHDRISELSSFEESVEKVLKAEWKHFVDCLEGKGNEYN